MPTVIQFARPPYTKRAVPVEYDNAWFAIELGNIQRAILPATILRVRTGLYVPTVKDFLLLADASAGPVNIKLPTPGRVHGLQLTIKRVDNTLANPVTILGTVDGTLNPTIAAQYAGLVVMADDNDWWRLGTF